jgi:tetratricopeptide (TPR) repeat protein
MPRVSGVERFAVAPMKRDEAEHYIATIAHDRYARSVDPVVLDHLSPELWSLPGVVDVLLPSLLDVTPDLGVWLPDHPEVRNVELALRAFVGQLDPAERRLLSALAVAPTTDQRIAIEATGVPEPLEQLLDLVRRGLLVREANAFGVPAVLRAQLPRSDLQACFDELSRRELEHLAADGAGKRLGHLVSVAASEYDLDLDLATLSSAGVLDALNADGQWGSYLMVLDLALANPTEATDRADLRLRRIRKRIQLGHLAEAGSDLAAFEKSAHHPTELIDAHSHRALLLFATGDYVAALGSIAEAQGLAEEEGDQARLAKVANLMGNLLVAHGTPRLALEAFAGARRFARKVQDSVTELDAEIGYINAAVVAGEAVDVEAALEGLGEACLAGGRRTQLARLHYLAAQQLETEAPEDARAHAELARQWSDGGSVIFALAEGLLDRLHRASPHTREEGEA